MISVVIPTLNEERALAATLDKLLAQSAEFEVVIADGGSKDRTLDIAARYDNVQTINANRGRASQMNAGAALATGEWLLFLHADTWLPPGALQCVAALSGDATCRSGGFRHRFRGNDWRLDFISWLDNLRCRHTSIIYGDQAMFVRRSDFREVGGFDEDCALEDVAICEVLAETSSPRLLDPEVLTDGRKFLQLGVWRSLLRVAGILTRHELGLPIPRSHPFFENVR